MRVRRVSLESGADFLYITAEGGTQTYSFTGSQGSYSALQFNEQSFNMYVNVLIQYTTEVTNMYELEMATAGRPAGRAGPGRKGLKDFSFVIHHCLRE